MKTYAILAGVFVVALGVYATDRFAHRQSRAQDWADYRERFIKADGRLVDSGDVSHSEGQGYALVLAALHEDAKTFEAVWRWTRANLQIRQDHLVAWRWRPGDNPHVADSNNATDGDLLIAWGLAEAGKRFHEREYVNAAHEIALGLADHALFPSARGPMLRPGAAGFGEKDSADGPVVNLSYWVFPAFTALAEVAPEVDWRGLSAAGLALFDEAQFGPLKMPSDWISLHDGVKPAAGRPAVFGYELVRAPLYLAWGPPEAKARLAALTRHWLDAAGGEPLEIDVAQGVAGGRFEGAGYRAVIALARCAAFDAPFPDQLRKLSPGGYYAETLHLLSLSLLNERYPQC